MARLIDLTGRQFGLWYVIGHPRRVVLRSSRKYLWLCRCSCGVEREVVGGDLREGKSQSCGCLGLSYKRHDLPEYKIWIGLRSRCRNPNSSRWHRYGGRGISVCARWEDFETFYRDMGPRPSSTHTIERRNNDGDYCPENCVWATKKEQSRNTRRNKFLLFRGERLTYAAWAERLGMRPATFRNRLRSGWSVEQVITTPVRPRP